MLTLRPHQQDALEAMTCHSLGQCIMPTGAGKTYVMVADAMEQLKSGPKTLVVVSPRILLSLQLCEDFMQFLPSTWVHVCHAHSGKTDYFSSTKAEKIALFNNTARAASESCIIFTTYNSLHRVQESGINVDTIYFDEAHNSVKRNFFPATEHFSNDAERCYFFTATPKHSVSIFKPGMNDAEVYGQVICNVPAPKLVDEGYILPPKVSIKELPQGDFKQSDCQNLLDTIDGNSLDKILIAARSTRQIVKLLAESDFYHQLRDRGYSCLYITSKTGAFIDGVKVHRDEFFSTLNAWGKDPDKRFVVIHHSILSEGINVPGLEAVLFMRNMDCVGISQSIGRVIRLGSEHKTYGLVCVPVFDKVGISTAKSVQSVVETVFEKGQPAVSVVRK